MVIVAAVVTTVVVPAVVVAVNSLVLHRCAKLFLDDYIVLEIVTCVLIEGARSVHGVSKLFPEEGGWFGRISFGSKDLGFPDGLQPTSHAVTMVALVVIGSTMSGSALRVLAG